MARHYSIGGRKLPSVTTVLDAVINPGEGLLRWACDLGWEESRRVFREAGQRGTDTHEYIAKTMEGNSGNISISERVQPYAASFDISRDSLASVRLVSYEGERCVSCDVCGYAGTLDAYVKFSKHDIPRSAVIDYKTSSRIRKEVALQLAAYTHALMGHDTPFEKWPERWAFRLQGDGSLWEPKRYFRHERDWRGFKAALDLYNVLKEIK